MFALLAVACRPPGNSGDAAPRTVFVERSAEVELDFVHVDGGTGQLYFPEIMGPGAGLFDYDNDGDLDAYLVQGGDLAPIGRPSKALGDRLFRNDLVAGRPETLAFTDVTEESGLRATGYGMGVATGDFDNDGWVDLYVTNFGSNQLWRNNGDGTFSDVTDPSGTNDPRWSMGSTFFDLDNDGWLDLLLANYVDYRLASARPCFESSGLRDYCGPLAYEAETATLFHNQQDGRFDNVTGPAGLLTAEANGLGVLATDLDADGWQDIFVASDQMSNLLWRNEGDGTFSESALLAGVALSRQGRPEAGMGVVAADLDGDGDEDLLLTHLDTETHTLYRNLGSLTFSDASDESRLGAASLGFTGFGVDALDFDNDGWLDVVAVNGAVKRMEPASTGTTRAEYAQRHQLFRNLGQGSFEEVAAAEAGLGPPTVGRGLAVGDVDNDGDEDVLVANGNGPAALFVNEVGNSQPWVGLRLVNRKGRDAIGARVGLQRRSAEPLWRRVHSDGSYLSARDPRVLFGLAADRQIESVRVVWPDGSIELFPAPELGAYSRLVQGSGTAP